MNLIVKGEFARDANSPSLSILQNLEIESSNKLPQRAQKIGSSFDSIQNTLK